MSNPWVSTERLYCHASSYQTIIQQASPFCTSSAALAWPVSACRGRKARVWVLQRSVQQCWACSITRRSRIHSVMKAAGQLAAFGKTGVFHVLRVWGQRACGKMHGHPDSRSAAGRGPSHIPTERQVLTRFAATAPHSMSRTGLICYGGYGDMIRYLSSAGLREQAP